MNTQQPKLSLQDLRDAGIDTLGLTITKKGSLKMTEPTKPGMPKALVAKFESTPDA